MRVNVTSTAKSACVTLNMKNVWTAAPGLMRLTTLGLAKVIDKNFSFFYATNSTVNLVNFRVHCVTNLHILKSACD